MKRNRIGVLFQCMASVVILGMFSSQTYAEDSNREKVIREKTLGYDAQESAIAVVTTSRLLVIRKPANSGHFRLESRRKMHLIC